MSEATGGGREEMERRLIQRSLEVEDFRQRLLEDPRAAVEQELGAQRQQDPVDPEVEPVDPNDGEVVPVEPQVPSEPGQPVPGQPTPQQQQGPSE